MTQNQSRLAIIGTGIAGLSACWLLKDHFDITVFESAPRAGMGVHTFSYEHEGQSYRIDVPLRIFCEGYYDNLMALYRLVGVDIQTSDHAGQFANTDGEVYLHYGNRHFLGRSRMILKGNSLRNPESWRLGIENHRFLKRARSDLAEQRALSSHTFGEYLSQQRINEQLVRQILLPIMSVTCTCDYQSVLNYPADMMLEYLTCGIAEWGILNAAKGVDDIVPRLLSNAELRTNSPIQSVEPIDQSIRVTTADNESALFDHVIIASQAQQAAALLSGFDQQKKLLERVPFERSIMSVHTDKSILPTTRAPASPVSYCVPPDAERAEVSVDLSKAFERYRGQESVFQTWNPLRELRAGSELARVEFTRPVVTLDSRAAVSQLREHQAQQNNRLWFCGSYMADKIPLLDGAVDSSVNVARQLGVEAPWAADG